MGLLSETNKHRLKDSKKSVEDNKASASARRTARNKSKKATKTAKLGSGKRFSALSNSLKKEGYSKKSAGAIAASIGRKKYGGTKMAKMSSKGRKR
jgi:hypothetical protein